MGDVKPVDDDLVAWSIDARHNVQRAIHELYRCNKALDKVTEPTDAETNVLNVYHLLAGTAFALWRALFLADTEERCEETALEGSGIFLRKIFESNIIGFGDELSAKQWSAGHYLSNAIYRLARVLQFAEEVNTKSNFREFSDMWSNKKATAVSDLEWTPIRKPWDMAFAAMVDVISWLIAQVRIKPRYDMFKPGAAHYPEG